MVGQAEPVVTGDAVVLDVQIAQLPVRALSALIDVLVIFVGYVAGVMLWAITLSEFDPALSGGGADHLHGVDDRRLSGDLRERDPRQDAGQDGTRTAGGFRRRRPGTIPAGALSRRWHRFIEIWMFFGGPAVICSLLSPKGKRHR